MKRLILIALFALPLLAQTSPVPPERLRDNTLLGAHFELPAPGRDWRWVRLAAAEEAIRKAHPETEQETFLVIQPETKNSYMFLSMADGTKILPNAMFMSGVEDGIRRTFGAAGSTVTDFRSAPSTIPIDGASYRFRFKVTSANGTVIYRIGYIGGEAMKYQFLLSTATDEEPAGFTKFVQGFALK